VNAKDYLLQIQKLDRLIENKLMEVAHWKAVATGTTVCSEGDRVQSSGSKQKMADAVCRYLHMEDEINADIDRLVDIKQDIIKTIEQLPVKEYDLLHKIYVQGMEMYEAAVEMDKSYRWATSVHGRALANVQKMLDEREQNE
jgi:DNA-directed RNA polymerase specialized sigma24 family protein